MSECGSICVFFTGSVLNLLVSGPPLAGVRPPAPAARGLVFQCLNTRRVGQLPRAAWRPAPGISLTVTCQLVRSVHSGSISSSFTNSSVCVLVLECAERQIL